MQSITCLSREHGAIASLLGRFEEALDAAERGEPDIQALERLLDFLEERIDGQHQEKEERVFLPRLLTRARGADVERVRSVLAEHVEQRERLVELRCCVQGLDWNRPAACTSLIELGRRYLARQRLHAAWEDAVVLPLAANVLTTRDDRAIRNGFRHLDETWHGPLEEAVRRLLVWLDSRSPALAG